MDDPASACATAGIARNGGATITSRSRASSAATGSINALSAAIKARPSAGFRFIFQLAANSFLRIEGLRRGESGTASELAGTIIYSEDFGKSAARKKARRVTTATITLTC